MRGDRGRVHLTDVVMMLITTVAAVRTAPIYYNFASDVTAASGPLTGLLLELVVPFLLIGIVISAGISGVRNLRGAGQ